MNKSKIVITIIYYIITKKILYHYKLGLQYLYENLGQIYKDMGKLNEAEECFSKSI